MKIAVSGSHQTGKTSLVEELSKMLPAYFSVDEPYYLLEEEGHEFVELPGREDFEIQLHRSVQSIQESEEDQIFDRCPADFIAYLLPEMDPGSSDYHQWMALAMKGMEWLDLIVFVPIEDPDRITVPELAYTAWRINVDRILRDIVLRDTLEEFGVEMLEVSGSTRERARQVIEWIEKRSRLDR